MTREERIETFCRRCGNWIDEQEIEEMDGNDIPHCCVDGLGLVTSRCERDGRCREFYEI